MRITTNLADIRAQKRRHIAYIRAQKRRHVAAWHRLVRHALHLG